MCLFIDELTVFFSTLKIIVGKKTTNMSWNLYDESNMKTVINKKLQ